MKKHIPNMLTSMNLFSGSIATVMAFQGEFLWVVVWVIIAALFDFSDGFAARLLKAYSPIGKELDSLADMVSFGLAPSVAVFSLLSANVYKISDNSLVVDYLPYIAFLLAVFSALRLAKFNVDERQTESFIGLNTPANALFWVSLCYGLTYNIPSISVGLIYTLLVGIFVFSALMVSEIPMFSLKIKSLKLKGNEYRYFLAIFIIALVAYIGVLGIAGGILLYIALSIINSRKPV
ncbi:phosphatidylcholine/phosphatidylserine synthase [Dysgonomonas sp. BGC7]|uniref:CDP-alcohol phosphatidyltransferase family protein n=1 Tax=Dysgonomonas sp. BGC7 TaxID=1658008 RepID=UPI0006828875|nr:CDP-alcohol phosphatidyltransferase family protein [Dysgonomonas sp. BGC7]MBD8387519.1 CDP-alcohol phosphatidyltransferase family protein [Dysgonomonas sp. BGC7]